MGLERRGGGFYFYRKVRRGKQVVSEYAGGRLAAPLMAQIEALDRERKREARVAWEGERTRKADEDAKLAELYDRIEGIARHVLEAAGYHRHKRGEWRRRRMAKDKSRALVPRDVEGRM